MSDENHLCHVCNEPVNLQTTSTDEDGKVVHGNCYVLRFSKERVTPTVQEIRIPPLGLAG
jgi:hypothetical protein